MSILDLFFNDHSLCLIATANFSVINAVFTVFPPMKTSIFVRMVAAFLLLFSASSLGAEQIYATNGTAITRFNTNEPRIVATVPVTGMQSGETLVSIDLRPSTNELFGIGNMSLLYSINATTGVATQVGSGGAFTLNGTTFGMDFNPVADRIRVVSNAEQNMRLNPNIGTLAAMDTDLTPAGNTVEVAYENNFVGANLTTLYAIDSVTGQLEMIGGTNGTPSANAGAVTAIGSLGLGTNLNGNIGFDITGVRNKAFATITVDGQSRLYSINLITGGATNLGVIGSGTTSYLGMTAGPALPLPADKAPKVRISGKSDRKTTQTSIKLSGTSSDDFAVTKVEYRIGSGKFLKAKGTTTWSVTIKLTKAVTRVYVRATDDIKQVSAVASVIIRKGH
jgi:hypothetical protein